MAAVALDAFDDMAPALYRKVPDEAQKFKIELLWAALRQICPATAIILEDAQQHTADAGPARIVEPEEGVGTRHAKVVGVGKIALHDPGGRGCERGAGFAPIIKFRGPPAAVPVMQV